MLTISLCAEGWYYKKIKKIEKGFVSSIKKKEEKNAFLMRMKLWKCDHDNFMHIMFITPSIIWLSGYDKLHDRVRGCVYVKCCDNIFVANIIQSYLFTLL